MIAPPAVSLGMILWGALLPVTAPVVEGEIDCPSPARVQALLPRDDHTDADPATPPGRPGVRVRLLRDDHQLRIEVRDPDGPRVWSRTLPTGSSSCSALAQAAAVVIATGLGELRAEARPLPEAAATPGPSRPPTLPGALPPTSAAPSVASAVSPSPRWRAEIGAAVGAQVNGAQVTAAGSGEVSLWRQGSRLAGRLTIGGTSFNVAPYSGGEAAWLRVPFGLGVRWRFQPTHRLLVDGQAELLNALVVVEGRGYAQARRTYGYDPGLALGTRLALRLGEPRNIHPFVGLTLSGWPRPHEVYLQQVAGQQTLPQLDLQVRIGIAFESGLR